MHPPISKCLITMTKSCTKEATKLITKLLEIIQAVDMSWTYQIRTKLCQADGGNGIEVLRVEFNKEFTRTSMDLVQDYYDSPLNWPFSQNTLNASRIK
ncbi:hypothetical protein ISN44_As12g031460 [Arabidopsis suecica]|uniref:Uncharacterized protein n=1 Tax=Arabidopsis suecica TaxID=45249 RepID=A0A8T1YNX2_ARASU|nr:hypothetical protein ISN44_As12g031460 [Arabidopsis suecica]